MDDENIIQTDALEMDMDSANSDLNNTQFKSVTQSIDDLAEAIIEQLLADERLKKMFKQPGENDKRKERRLLNRQKNKEQQYLSLEDLVAQENSSLASSIKSNQFASVHDKFHRALVLSGFFFLKIASTFLNSSFFPKPIKRRIAI